MPGFPESTPVIRSPKTAAGPTWLNGTDSGVRQASGLIGNSQPQARPLVPSFGAGKDNTSVMTKAKGTTPSPAEAAGANTPFRGTSAGGTPVYAGPPAYRWYGYGTVTPGANPFAPGGQYPKASANWYSITGATPGAFPVPVTNPGKVAAPGTEPPMYVSSPPPRVAPAALPAQTAAPASMPTTIAPTTPHVPPPADLSRSGISSANPLPLPTTPLPAMPVTVPTLSAPPGTAAPPITERASSARDAEPVNPAPLPQIPAAPIAEMPRPPAPIMTPAPASPGALPASVTDDQPNWQPSRDGRQWTPPGSPQSRSASPQPVARGQAEDARPDPAVTLIRQLCAGRASGVDVRWTGSKKLTVGFECPTAAAARQLVRDISARPELGPLQIDFAVQVR
jgi:hypothetical protein